MSKRETVEETMVFVKTLPKLMLELDRTLRMRQEKYYMNVYQEEGYYQDIWQVYKLSLIDFRLTNLVHLFKHPDTEEFDKRNIKQMLILCNTWLILKILRWLNTDNEWWIWLWELISEGYQALIDSIEKFEIDFTHEKSTKHTTIKLIEKQEDWILVEIKSNKPFWTIDITLKYTDDWEKFVDNNNYSLEWEDFWDMYKTRLLLEYDNLENDYSEIDSNKIKLSVSKKVSHISTFLTNNIFFWLKNFLNKATPLKISNNYQILRNQMLKIKEKYEEKFHSEPTERWIAYYLLIQNRSIWTLDSSQIELYEKYLKNPKWLSVKNTKKAEKLAFQNIDIIIKKDSNKWTYLTINQDTKRILMIQNKGVSDKNKDNFLSFWTWWLQWEEDLVLYEKVFEKLIQRKLKEIDKVKHYQWVEQLDKKINDQDWTTVWDLIWDDSIVLEMLNDIDLTFKKSEVKNISKSLLTPQEYHYYNLYFEKQLDFDKFIISKNNSSTIKTILKKAFIKILYYVQYKTLISK